MSIKRLEITGVRNLQGRLSLSNLASVNVFWGVNGSGKTSVLEAIYILGMARSFRSTKIKPVINQSAEDLTVFGEVLAAATSPTVPIGVHRTRRGEGRIKIGGVTATSAAQLAENLPLQLINSQAFQLLEGGPSVRRQFVDWGVFHVEHRFLSEWRRLQRCLKQRNTLLRHDKMDAAQLALWDRELDRVAAAVDEFRRVYFEQFADIFTEVLAELTDLKGIILTYHRGWDSEQSLEPVLAQSFDRDRQQGFTHHGPHRADVRVKIDGISAVDVLSRGQQKLLVCALRLAQGFLLERKTGRRCVYLVDDLPSELDAEHRQRVCTLLERLDCQVFITCVDKKDLDGCWSDSTALEMFHVEQGRVVRAEREPPSLAAISTNSVY